MKRMKCVPLLLLVGGVLFVTCTFHVRGVVAGGEEVDFIVNKANTVHDLSLVDVKKVLLGDKSTWPNGKRITVLMARVCLPAPWYFGKFTRCRKTNSDSTSCRPHLQAKSPRLHERLPRRCK